MQDYSKDMQHHKDFTNNRIVSYGNSCNKRFHVFSSSCKAPYGGMDDYLFSVSSRDELEQELNGEMYSAQVFGKDDSWHIFDSALGLVAKRECFSLNQVLEMFDNLSHEGDRS